MRLTVTFGALLERFRPSEGAMDALVAVSFRRQCPALVTPESRPHLHVDSWNGDQPRPVTRAMNPESVWQNEFSGLIWGVAPALRSCP